LATFFHLGYAENAEIHLVFPLLRVFCTQTLERREWN
jgi:hypothetical protein